MRKDEGLDSLHPADVDLVQSGDFGERGGAHHPLCLTVSCLTLHPPKRLQAGTLRAVSAVNTKLDGLLLIADASSGPPRALAVAITSV